MPPRSSTQSRPSSKRGKRKPRVNFGANGSSRKRKASPVDAENSDAEPSSSPKRPRNDNASGSTGGGASSSTGTTGTGAARGAGSADADASTDAAANDASTKKTPPTGKTRARTRFGIRPLEVPPHAKTTQTAFQRFICGISGVLKQSDVLPSATEARKHYDKRFDADIDDMHEHMRNLVNESRTAVSAARDFATKLIRDAKLITGPIANDIARIPETHLATVFTMIQKAGLKGFCPDLEGPVQSKYNQLHRHLAVSGFQFLSSSFALAALDVNASVAEDTELLGDMYDGYAYGRLATKTKMERRRPGSLTKSLQNSAEYKARSRLADTRFKTANRLELRKPVQRMANITESHSDDEHHPQHSLVRKKPGRNPIMGRFYREELDVSAEEYRTRNAKAGQRAPKPRTRQDPLLPASYFGKILPPDVPVDFFTPEFYNGLTLKERARYANTGVAFPLPKVVFDPAHANWRYLGKKDFMDKYGYDVLEQYDIPSAEEIDAIPESDVEDDEEIEIDLEDTDDEEGEMDVDDDGNAV
ncbi:hypothetical protein C8F04DRAFT_1359439 [Mycena alexandri]|uniref:Uncharacterized protein n=1 Tax=Mycena alexandri TaxID=1745969 RepID=A0AAD6SR69_9AGAR|nr:hypothetical protein C8F04DRAFT_1359439 [Mycena alexandri]